MNACIHTYKKTDQNLYCLMFFLQMLTFFINDSNFELKVRGSEVPSKSTKGQKRSYSTWCRILLISGKIDASTNQSHDLLDLRTGTEGREMRNWNWHHTVTPPPSRKAPISLKDWGHSLITHPSPSSLKNLKWTNLFWWTCLSLKFWTKSFSELHRTFGSGI